MTPAEITVLERERAVAHRALERVIAAFHERYAARWGVGKWVQLRMVFRECGNVVDIQSEGADVL